MPAGRGSACIRLVTGLDALVTCPRANQKWPQWKTLVFTYFFFFIKWLGERENVHHTQWSSFSEHPAPLVVVIPLCLLGLHLICSIHVRRKISPKATLRSEINLPCQSEQQVTGSSASGKKEYFEMALYSSHHLWSHYYQLPHSGTHWPGQLHCHTSPNSKAFVSVSNCGIFHGRIPFLLC